MATKHKTNYISIELRVNYKGDTIEDQATGIRRTELLCFSPIFSKGKDLKENERPGFDTVQVKVVNKGGNITLPNGNEREIYKTNIELEHEDTPKQIEKGTSIIVEGWLSRPYYYTNKKTNVETSKIEINATKIIVLSPKDKVNTDSIIF